MPQFSLSQITATTKASSARIRELEHALAECYRIAGSDAGMASDKQLAGMATQAVRELRRDYDEAIRRME